MSIFPIFLLLPLGAFLIFMFAIFGAIFGLFGKQGHQRVMRQAAIPVERLRREVINGLSYVDTYLELLPASPMLTANQRIRQETAALYDQAKSVAQTARQPQDFGRAEALLGQANQNILNIKQYIDRATGGTGFAVAVDGTDYRVTPGTADGATFAAPVLTGMNPADIPPAERAACFFCSRPARISELTPVTIALNGQRRKVLACADDVQTVQRGATPQVRTVMESGRPTAWYHARSYDPYRDYSYAHVSYYPAYTYYDGYNSGIWDGFLLGSLFYEPTPVAYPVFVGNDGFITNEPFAAAPPLVMQDSFGGADNFSGSDNSSADFFGGNSGFDSSGGADFGGNSGGFDFGNGQDNVGGADFGSGQDNVGGADFGGSSSTDFGASSSSGFDSGGGSDFGGGGSDFGGGGDSGGGGGDSGGGGGDY